MAIGKVVIDVRLIVAILCVARMVARQRHAGPCNGQHRIRRVIRHQVREIVEGVSKVLVIDRRSLALDNPIFGFCII
jgi:hypothetical protein